MDNSLADNRGTISRKGNVMHVDNALVEEVVTNNGRTGYMLISYGVRGQKGKIYIEVLRLNVGRDTIITNQLGEHRTLSDIRKGMWVDAEFSSAMTRSIPPQSTAFRIIVRQDEPSVNVTTDRVVSVDVENGFLYTGNPYEISEQIRFVISNTTVIVNRNGYPIRLRSIKPGQMVKVQHATFQTMSIPPQTTAFFVQVL